MLFKLDISGNDLREPGCSVLAAALSSTQITDLNVASNKLTRSMNQQHFDFSGITKFAEAIKDMGSLSELDLSNNNLRSEGLSVVSEALKSASIKRRGEQLDVQPACQT